MYDVKCPNIPFRAVMTDAKKCLEYGYGARDKYIDVVYDSKYWPNFIHSPALDESSPVVIKVTPAMDAPSQVFNPSLFNLYVDGFKCRITQKREGSSMYVRFVHDQLNFSFAYRFQNTEKCRTLTQVFSEIDLQHFDDMTIGRGGTGSDEIVARKNAPSSDHHRYDAMAMENAALKNEVAALKSRQGIDHRADSAMHIPAIKEVFVERDPIEALAEYNEREMAKLKPRKVRKTSAKVIDFGDALKKAKIA